MEPLPWYIITALIIAAISLFIIALMSIIKLLGTRNNKCLVCQEPEKYESTKCNKMLKKDFHHVVILFVVILVFIATNLLSGKKDAMDYFSFASTISSIILSVVAIIFSITGENKTDVLKQLLRETTKELESTTAALQSASEQITKHNAHFEELLVRTGRLEKNFNELNRTIQNQDKNTSASNYETEEV